MDTMFLKKKKQLMVGYNKKYISLERKSVKDKQMEKPLISIYKKKKKITIRDLPKKNVTFFKSKITFLIT